MRNFINIISEGSHCQVQEQDIEGDLCPACGMHKEWHRGLDPETMARSRQYAADNEARGQAAVARANSPLKENFTDDPALNRRIELALQEVSDGQDKETAQWFQDGLEIIHDAGSDGVTSGDWAKRMKALHPEMSAANLTQLMNVILKQFDYCVSRQPTADGKALYQFKRPNTQDGDVDPALRAAAGMQIEVTQHIINMMKAMGRFTPEAVAEQVAAHLGAQGPMAEMLVHHVLDQLQSQITTNDDGTYTFNEPVKKTTADHIQKFRDMLTQPRPPETEQTR